MAKPDPCNIEAIRQLESSLDEDRGKIRAILRQLEDMGVPVPFETRRTAGASTLMDLMEALKRMGVEEIPVGKILADPARFQFKKLEGAASNLTKQGVKEPLVGDRWMGAAEPLIGWRDLEGNIYVVEGHHRLEYAKRLKGGPESLPMHILEEAPGSEPWQGVDAKTAKAVGAMSNILQDHGEIEDYIAVIAEGFLTKAEIDEVLPLSGGSEGGYPRFPSVTTKKDKARLLAVEAPQVIRDSLKSEMTGTLSLPQAVGLTKGLRPHNPDATEAAAAWGLKKVAENPSLSGEAIGSLVAASAGIKKKAKGGLTQPDMFDFDDSIMAEIDQMAETVVALRSELRFTKRFTKFSDPDASQALSDATKGTLVVSDMEEMGLLNSQTAEVLRRLESDSWAMDPEMTALVRKRAGIEEKAVPATEEAAAEDAVEGIDYAQPVRVDRIISVGGFRFKMIMPKEASVAAADVLERKRGPGVDEFEGAGHLAKIREYRGAGKGTNSYYVEIAGQEGVDLGSQPIGEGGKGGDPGSLGPFPTWNKAHAGFKAWAAGETVEQGAQVAPVVQPTVQPAAAAQKSDKKGGYTGAVLNPDSRKRLMAVLDEEIPMGWTLYGHHMTTNLGAPGEGIEEGPQKTIVQGNVGKLAELTPVAIGISDKVIAIEVESDIPSINETKHITIAVAPGAKPYDSNKITSWQSLDSEQQSAIGLLVSDVKHITEGGTPEYIPEVEAVQLPAAEDEATQGQAAEQVQKVQKKVSGKAQTQKKRSAKKAGARKELLAVDQKTLKDIEELTELYREQVRGLRLEKQQLIKLGPGEGEVRPSDMAEAMQLDDKIQSLREDELELMHRGAELSGKIERAEAASEGAARRLADKALEQKLATPEYERGELVRMEGVDEPVTFIGVAGEVEGQGFSAQIKAGDESFTVPFKVLSSTKKVKTPVEVSEEQAEALGAAEEPTFIDDLFAKEEEEPC